jgi:hypothetical protein
MEGDNHRWTLMRYESTRSSMCIENRTERLKIVKLTWSWQDEYEATVSVKILVKHVWIRHLITCHLLRSGTFGLFIRRGDLVLSCSKHTPHVQHNSQKSLDEVVSNCPF